MMVIKKLILVAILLAFSSMAVVGQEYFPPSEDKTIVAISFFPEPDTASLPDLLEMRVGDKFSSEALRNSIRNIFQLGLYEDVKVSWSEIGNDISLKFELQEKPVIEGVTIIGYGPVSKQKIITTAQLESDSRYDETREQRIITELSRVYREEGYYSAGINIFNMVNLETGGIRLEINIEPGEPTLLEEVRLFGFPVLPEAEVMELLSQSGPGKIYREVAFKNELEKVRDYYRKKGFLTADVTLNNALYDAEKNVVYANLMINAGPVVKTVFNPQTDDEKLWLSQIPFSDKNIPVEGILDNGRSKITQHLKRNGYVDAQVEISYSVDEEAALQVEININKGTSIKVGNLLIDGIEEELVLEVLPRLNLSKKGWFSSPLFSEAALNEDIERIRKYLREEGFPLAKVTVERQEQLKQKDAVLLTLNVDPGPRAVVSSIAFVGNRNYETSELLPHLGLAVGDSLNARKINNSVQNLRDWYDSQGYSQAQINARTTGTSERQAMRIDIKEGEKGTITKIIIAGNSITDEDLVRDALTFKEGDPYSLQQIMESQRALYRMGTFDRVTISSIDEEISQKEKRVVVRLNEARPYSLLYGFGVDSDEKFRFSFGFSNSNISGRNIEAGFSTRVSQIQQRYQLSFSSPRIFGGLVDNTLRIFYEDLQRPGYGARKKGLILESSGLHFRGWNVIARAQTKWIDLFKVEPGVAVNRLEQPVHLNLFSTIFTRDTRDDLLDPTSGALYNGIIQFSPQIFGSDSGYVKAEGLYYSYRNVTPSILLATAFRFGLAMPFDNNDEIPISERFFMGGSTSLRAFDLDGVGPVYLGADGNFYPAGGNAMINASAELRFPLLAGMGGVTFYDLGNVYEKVEDVDLTDLEHALGLGLRFATPLGPLRFDFGKSLRTSDSQFYFTFGHAF